MRSVAPGVSSRFRSEGVLNNSDVVVDPRGGLKNVADIFIAPGAAFERIAVVPVWFWAYLVAAILTIVGNNLALPASHHELTVSMPAQMMQNPKFAAETPEQQSAAVAQTLDFLQKFAWVNVFVVPFVAALIAALVQGFLLWLACLIARARASFPRMYALSMTVSIIGIGVTYLVMGIIAAVRGPEAYVDGVSLPASVPGLALLGGHGFARGFLCGITIFSLWATFLLALGLQVVAGMQRNTAWIVSVVLLVLNGLLLGLLLMRA
jgi:hypothetical protein